MVSTPREFLDEAEWEFEVDEDGGEVVSFRIKGALSSRPGQITWSCERTMS